MSTHSLDQARAAAAHGNRFRTAAANAGRFVTTAAGPIDVAACRWADMPGREWLSCAHLPATAPPQPLFGNLADPGRLYCLNCAIAMTQHMKHHCAGCGEDHPDAIDIVLGHDNFLTLIGYACPACRNLCNTQPEGEETHG